MSEREQIVALVKGADVYRKQGLYEEAREKYLEALSIVSGCSDLTSQQEALKEIVKKRIQTVDEGIVETDEPELPPELSEGTQDLIKKLFSFSGTKEGSALQGAVALMKFGQYKRAVEEFETLLSEGVQPVVVARNIVNCALLDGSPEDAIDRCGRWGEKNLLSSRELLYVRDYIQSALAERGIQAELPSSPAKSGGERPERETQESEPEISTVTIDFESGELKGRSEEFKVTFQFGNVLSVLVPSSKKTLLRSFQKGPKLYHMGFYSPMAFFRGTGKITAMTLIKQGPRKGDYLFDIAIEEK